MALQPPEKGEGFEGETMTRHLKWEVSLGASKECGTVDERWSPAGLSRIFLRISGKGVAKLLEMRTFMASENSPFIASLDCERWVMKWHVPNTWKGPLTKY